MADSLLERYLADTGGYPASVGLSVWGTAAMRASGDDLAEVLALLGVRPVWDEASRRLSALEPIPLAELGRPRVTGGETGGAAADVAEFYAVWGGFAYGRGLDGRQARDDMERAYRRIAVAAHNTDTLEHDIADSDDYFQYHGGMIATVRALTGKAPRAYIGESTRPDTVRTRSLAEETARVFRARVVNPRWVEAMKRHGYKGAFELAATVDYLFGYDATAGVVEDWMYEKLAETYVRDQSMREFFARSNPWALHGITERLLEAADRKLWDAPEPETLAALRQAYLETEGDLEDR